MTAFVRRHPLIVGVAVLVLLFLVAASFPVVPETKQAVVVRFGKPVRILNRYEAGEKLGESGAGQQTTLRCSGERAAWLSAPDRATLDRLTAALGAP